MASRDQFEHAPALAVTTNGRNHANGLPSADPAHRPGPLPEASFVELFGRFVNDISDLADRQIELARQEINETRDEAVVTLKTTAIGAGVVGGGSLLLTIALWTALIWFLNWAFGHVSVGTIRLDFVGWIVGVVVPAAAAYIAYVRLVRPGIYHLIAMWPLFSRTRATLKEDLEWLQQQRTRSTR